MQLQLWNLKRRLKFTNKLFCCRLLKSDSVSQMLQNACHIHSQIVYLSLFFPQCLISKVLYAQGHRGFAFWYISPWHFPATTLQLTMESWWVQTFLSNFVSFLRRDLSCITWQWNLFGFNAFLMRSQQYRVIFEKKKGEICQDKGTFSTQFNPRKKPAVQTCDLCNVNLLVFPFAGFIQAISK